MRIQHAAKSLQSCPTLYDPIDGSPPGSPVPGILQARTLEWVAISFSNAWKWKVKGKSLSRVWLLATPWTAAYQAPPSMGFSRQSTGVGCHCLLRRIQHMLSLIISFSLILNCITKTSYILISLMGWIIVLTPSLPSILQWCDFLLKTFSITEICCSFWRAFENNLL